MASYRKKHIKGKIHRIKHPRNARKSIFIRPWFWIIILFLAISASVFYFFLFYSGIQVKNIIISGNQKIASKDIENLISDNINNKILSIRAPFGSWNLDSKSIFLIDNDRIEKDILQKFPVIEKVEINKHFPQNLILNVTERKSFGAYCQNNNQCFSIDQNGIIFEQLSVIPDHFVIVRQIFEDKQVFTGEEVVAQNIINVIYQIEKNLKDNFQIDLKEALITSPIRLDVKTSENWKIYFDLDVSSDINLQLTKLNLLLNGGIPAEPGGYSRKNLRYINLIPKDRAIICDNKICGG